VSDVPATDRVRRHARRALRNLIHVDDRLAIGRVAVVRTPARDLARPRPLVDILPDGRLHSAAVSGGEKRFSAVIVRYIRPLVVQVVVDHLADLRRYRHRPLAPLAVLDWGVRLRPMDDVQVRCLGVRVVVVDIEAVGGAHPHPGLGQDELGDVLDRGVLVLGEVVDYLLGPVDVQCRLSTALTVRNGRDLELLEQASLDGVDRLTPFDEDP